MREFSSPATYVLPTTGSLTDDVVGTRRGYPGGVAFTRRDGDGWSDVTCEIPRRGPGGGERAAGLGRGGRGPGRCCCRGPATSGRCWTTPSGTSARSPCRSTRRPPPSRSPGSDATPVRAPPSWRPPLTGNGWAGRAPDRTVRSRCGRSRTGAVEELVSRGRDVDERSWRHRRAAVTPATWPHRLHLRDDRHAQGLHAHPRQLHGRARGRHRGARRAFPGPDAATLLFLPMAHVLARIVSVGAVRARVRLGHSSGGPPPAPPTSRASAPLSCWPCPGCSRRCSTPPASGPPRDGRARGRSTARWRPPSPSAGPRWTAPRDACSGCGTGCSSASSTSGCAGCWGDAAGTPCRAALRWGSGSVTSTGASG